MITLSTVLEQATALSLSGFKYALQLQSEDTNYTSLSFEERLYHLFEAEINQRKDKRITRMLSQAKLKDKNASLEAIDYTAKRKLDKSQILSLASCEFINKSQNILINGLTGTGKSFIMQAFARRAISLGYSAKYYRIPALLEEIKMARLDGSYTKTLARISKFDLIKKTGAYFSTFSYNSPSNNQLNSASNFYSIHDVNLSYFSCARTLHLLMHL